MFSTLKIFSPKNIEDRMVPATGITKLNMEINPTLLYFNSTVQIEKAAADSIAKYNKIAVEPIVKFVT
jgi:hypothetical protein